MAPDEVHQSTAPSTTYFHIPGLGKSYKVGEELRVTVVARDFHQKPKQYGGDYFQAKLFSSKLKASVFGEVTDLENGSYSVHFLLPWSGEARVAVRLIHSSEAVQVLKQLRKYQSVRATERCRPGLQIPVPAGFYMRDVWTSLVCTTGHFNAPKITERELFMMGDSTMRQWYHYLGSSVPSMKYINLHSTEQAGPLLAVDVENNIVLHWRAHGTPLRSKAAPFVDWHYISNAIDSIAGGSRKVIIFNIWVHFTTHPLEYYIRRVARIRQAVIALLKRAPDTIVAIKSANTGSKQNVYGSDWFSIQLETILRTAFQGINVAFIDVWQMTSCHYSPESIHPNPTVIGNEINLLLSFICPV
ncbi:NXPE family member 3-like [Conger conger]|uniref:NXPE family member 3-like n=1 Tax=Conger conger TaxID=82655 RepID=UPI002A5A37B2|nr:NXPE family member 3-like [Conger conger]